MTAFLRNNMLASVAFAPDTEGSGGGDDDDLVLDDPAGEDGSEEDQDNPDDSESEADEPKTEEPAQPAQQVAARTPASQKFSALRSRAQDSERRARDAERRAEEAERRARQYEMQMRPPQPQESPEQERARLEMMTPDERAEYRVNRALATFQREQQLTAYRTQEQLDKQSFDTECRTNHLARRYANEVEEELNKVRAEGGNAPRQTVFYYVMGRALANQEAKTRDKRAATTQTRMRSAAVRPSSSRSDAASGRSQRGKSLEDRLDGVPI